MTKDDKDYSGFVLRHNLQYVVAFFIGVIWCSLKTLVCRFIGQHRLMKD